VEGRSFTREDVERDTRRLSELSPNREKGPDGTPRDKFLQDILITRAYARLVFGDNTPLLGKLLEDGDGDQYRIIGVVDPFYNPYGWPIHDYAIFWRLCATSGGLLPRETDQACARRPKEHRSHAPRLEQRQERELRPLVEIRTTSRTSARSRS
jgi:hypothetical protein